VETRFFCAVQTGAKPHPVSCTISTGAFLGIKRLGMALTKAFSFFSERQ
jgi:hypothetical protein